MYRFRKEAPKNEKDSKIPLAAGIMIHFFFNLGAVVFNNDILKWAIE
jgi:hypothetical protein